jgi:cytoskeletal protein CcmA (bactofilin family)
VFKKKQLNEFFAPKLPPRPVTELLSGDGLFEGELYARGDGVIDARFTGPAKSESLIGVGPHGHVIGPMQGRDISLAGFFEGDAIARQHLVMKKGCRVKGKCRSDSLDVEEGSSYEGLLVIGFDDKDITSSGKLRA